VLAVHPCSLAGAVEQEMLQHSPTGLQSLPALVVGILPYSLTGTDEHEWLWYSPTPSLKPV